MIPENGTSVRLLNKEMSRRGQVSLPEHLRGTIGTVNGFSASLGAIFIKFPTGEELPLGTSDFQKLSPLEQLAEEAE